MTHTTSEGTVRYGYLPSLPGMPKLIVVARVIVIGLSTMWALIICGLWVAGRSESQSTLGPILTSFALGMDSGGWTGYLLTPLAGCVLTVTMGRGHAIDRYLFTVLSLGWMWWLSRGAEFIGGFARRRRCGPLLWCWLSFGAHQLTRGLRLSPNATR